MRQWRLFSNRVADVAGDQGGSAAIEFVVAGMILLVPLVYLVLAIASIQAGAFAVEGAARQAARMYVRAATPEDAQADADAAVRFALADYGVASGDAVVRIHCLPDPAHCLRRHGFVTVSVTTSVALPLSPPAFGGGPAFSAPLTATATQQVSRFTETD